MLSHRAVDDMQHKKEGWYCFHQLNSPVWSVEKLHETGIPECLLHICIDVWYLFHAPLIVRDILIKLTLAVHHCRSVKSNHSNGSKENNKTDHQSEGKLECMEEPLSMNPHIAKAYLEDDHSQ